MEREMLRRLTRSEALEMVETTFDVSPETISLGLLEVFVAEMSVDQAQMDLSSYLSVIAASIDPDSIEVHYDQIDGSDMDCCRIVIKTGEAI
jgi:hypothetical protein